MARTDVAPTGRSLPPPNIPQPPIRQGRNGRPIHHRIAGLLLGLGLVLLIIFAALQHQAVYDWIALRGYQVPAEIAALSQADGLTPEAQKILYVNHPELNDKPAFNANCPNNGGEQTIVLGCYKSDQRGIYVYRVDDPQLHGVKEVTTAHEMLHAAYDRLSYFDRKKVDAMLLDYYNNHADKQTKATIDAYRSSEPDDLINEMHSIFGTEVSQLPADLEQYYSRYFTNRAQVVAYAQTYSAVFTTRKDKIAAYDAQLNELKPKIEANKQSLGEQSASLSEQRRQLEALRNSGNTAAYNRQVDGYNGQVNAYNSMLRETQSMITEYNSIVDQRNAIAIEEQNLAQSLDSRLPSASP